jgi:hypothetical protein
MARGRYHPPAIDYRKVNPRHQKLLEYKLIIVYGISIFLLRIGTLNSGKTFSVTVRKEAAYEKTI